MLAGLNIYPFSIFCSSQYSISPPTTIIRNQIFSYIFRGYRNGTPAWDWWIYQAISWQCSISIPLKISEVLWYKKRRNKQETRNKLKERFKKKFSSAFNFFSFQIFYFAPILFFIMVLCKSSGVTMFFQKLVNPSKSSVQKFDMHGMSKQKNHTLSYLIQINGLEFG